jgi:hypothetical protein
MRGAGVARATRLGHRPGIAARRSERGAARGAPHDAAGSQNISDGPGVFGSTFALREGMKSPVIISS